MKEVVINKKTHQIPESLNELSTDQLLRFVEAVFFKGISNINHLKVAMLQAVTGWPDSFFALWKKDAAAACLLNCPMACKEQCAEDSLFLQELRPVVDIMDGFLERISKEDAPDTFTLAPLLHLQKMPVLILKHAKFYGPGDLIADLEFDKWIEADIHYIKYLNTSDPSHLNDLLFALYQPRYEEMSRKLARRIRKDMEKGAFLKRLNPMVRHAVFLFYMSSRGKLTEHFKSIFTAPEKGEKDAMNAWYKVKHAVARAGAFGSFDEVGKTKIMDMMSYLHLQKKEAVENRIPKTA